MKKFKNFCDYSIKIIFSILLVAILVINLYYAFIDNSKIFLYSFLLLFASVIVFWLYRNRFIDKKKYFLYFILVILFGTILRLYFIHNMSFNLASDFDFTFQNAKDIINGTLKAGDYLAFNGYSYIYSYIISLLFRVFNVSVNTVLYFNLVCQFLTVYLIYKIISIKFSKETSICLATFYYMLPTIILAGLLVSTEVPFLLLFMLTIYLFYKIKDKRDFKLTSILSMIGFGIVMSMTNYIRPVMSVFLIALIIYWIINTRKIKEILLLLLVLLSYSSMNSVFDIFIEHGIGQEMRSGALGWSVYFGSNYNYCGSWSPEDSEFTSNYLLDKTKGDKDLILLSFERYIDYGPIKSVKLLGCKYRNLWVNNVGTYGFLYDVLDHDNSLDFASWGRPLESIGYILTIIMVVLALISMWIEVREKKEHWLFLELFGLGYILSNLIVCLNGRYNIPLYPILLICSSIVLEKLLRNDVKGTKEVTLEKLNKKKIKTLLIIPAYNEEESIEKTVEQIKKYNYDYIIINDGSKDKTLEICKKNNYNYVSLISNLGIGGAVQTGYQYAKSKGYDIAVQFDADGQHDISYVESLIKPIIEGESHFVVGSRFIDKGSSEFNSTLLRRIGINLISWLIKVYSGKRIYDTTSGFRAANKEIISRFAENYPAEYPEPISSFELLKLGYKIEEVPVSMNERQGGQSSISSWKNAYYMLNVLLSIIIVQIRGDVK